MAFMDGSVSYARHLISGDPPAQVDQMFLDLMAENTINPTTIGAPQELEYGWTAGRHVFDAAFDLQHNVFGSRLTAGMRIDTNRVPAELRRAYRAMAESEQASGTEIGVLSRAERTAAKEAAEDRCRRELVEGRHRSSKMTPLMWDVSQRLLFAPTFSDAKVAALRDLLKTTFDCRLTSLSAGSLACELLSARGQRREYEDLAPSPFTKPPANAADEDMIDDRPVIPWVGMGPEPNDFLGNEFLIWLWRLTDVDGGDIATTKGTVHVVIDRILDMQCAWDATGSQSLRAHGPARLPEAIKALQHGKWPRKVGLLVHSAGEQWELTFQADRFLITGLRVPKPEQELSSVRDVVEHRLDSITQLDAIMVELFDTFLRHRVDPGWPTRRQKISEWIRRTGSAAHVEVKPEPVPEVVTA